jgi:hypothetical protein
MDPKTLSDAERARLRQNLKPGDRVVAREKIVYPASAFYPPPGGDGFVVPAGGLGDVVLPELVRPIVRVRWDAIPQRPLTTNVADLDAVAERERDRAKRLGEPTCKLCGCSERDACPGGCAWATTSKDLCSGCCP